jgi:hypothetical protein
MLDALFIVGVFLFGLWYGYWWGRFKENTDGEATEVHGGTAT